MARACVTYISVRFPQLLSVLPQRDTHVDKSKHARRRLEGFSHQGCAATRAELSHSAVVSNQYVI